MSCSKCPARGFNNGSDITIGDYWELENKSDSANDNKGMSLIIIHTPMGKSWIERIQDKIEMQEVDYNDILSSGYHRTLLYSATIHPNRSDFFYHLENTDIVSSLIDFELQKPAHKMNVIKAIWAVLHKQYHKVLYKWRKR